MNRGDCWASIPGQLVPVKWPSNFLAFWCRKFEDLQISGCKEKYVRDFPHFIAKTNNPVMNKVYQPQFRAGVCIPMYIYSVTVAPCA
jgi:hypothetical protein